MSKNIQCPNCGFSQPQYKSMKQDNFITCIKCNYKWIMLSQNNLDDTKINFLLNNSITKIDGTQVSKAKPELVQKAYANNNSTSSFSKNFKPNVKSNSTFTAKSSRLNSNNASYNRESSQHFNPTTARSKLENTSNARYNLDVQAKVNLGQRQTTNLNKFSANNSVSSARPSNNSVEDWQQQNSFVASKRGNNNANKPTSIPIDYSKVQLNPNKYNSTNNQTTDNTLVNNTASNSVADNILANDTLVNSLANKSQTEYNSHGSNANATNKPNDFVDYIDNINKTTSQLAGKQAQTNTARNNSNQNNVNSVEITDNATTVTYFPTNNITTQQSTNTQAKANSTTNITDTKPIAVVNATQPEIITPINEIAEQQQDLPTPEPEAIPAEPVISREEMLQEVKAQSKFNTNALNYNTNNLDKLKSFDYSQLEVKSTSKVDDLVKNKTSKIKESILNRKSTQPSYVYGKQTQRLNSKTQSIKNTKLDELSLKDLTENIDINLYNNVDINSLQTIDDTKPSVKVENDNNDSATQSNNLLSNVASKNNNWKAGSFINVKGISTVLFGLLLLVFIMYVVSQTSVLDEKKPALQATTIDVNPILLEDLTSTTNNDNVDVEGANSVKSANIQGAESNTASGTSTQKNSNATNPNNNQKQALVLDNKTLLGNQNANNVESGRAINPQATDPNGGYKYFTGLKLSAKRRWQNLVNDVTVSSTLSKWQISLLNKQLITTVTLHNTSGSQYMVNKLQVVFVDSKNNILAQKDVNIKQVIAGNEKINLVLKFPDAPVNASSVYVYIVNSSKL